MIIDALLCNIKISYHFSMKKKDKIFSNIEINRELKLLTVFSGIVPEIFISGI